MKNISANYSLFIFHYSLNCDQQGSITGLVDDQRNLVEEYSYDAWGRRRNPTNWTYDNTPVPQFIFRGYTMHEMLDEFALINMNGRCYDPVAGRFLSPDIIIQDGNNTQCYNKYSYCVNNPLKYTDPSGWAVDALWSIHGKQFGVNHNLINYMWNLQKGGFNAAMWGNLVSCVNSLGLSGSNGMEGIVGGEITFIWSSGIAPGTTEELMLMASLKQAYSTPIDISNYTAQQFSEAFLGICAYEQFFGDGTFTMGKHFTGDKETYSFQGDVIMNRGGYEYNSYMQASFKLSDNINLDKTEYNIPRDPVVQLSTVTITSGSGSFGGQNPSIQSYSKSCTVNFSDVVLYTSTNLHGGTWNDFVNHATFQITYDGDKLVNGLKYRFDKNNTGKARYGYNNYVGLFGVNWWYRY